MKEINERNFPSNSYKSRIEKREERPKIEKAIKGNVVKKKKTLGKKMAETFLGDDRKSVTQYIIYDVLIPSAKAMIWDIISGGSEMLLFGETKGRNTRRDKGKSYVSYSNYYDSDKRDRNRSSRARHNFDDLIFDSRGEAEEVLSRLVDLVEDYGVATVADLYDLAGVTSEFTDNKWGWNNLSSASVSRVRDGYLITLPKVILIE